MGCKTSETTKQPTIKLTPVVMQLDWIFNAQFAGFYQAIDQGYFADEGIEVELRAGPTAADIVDGTLYEPAISFGSSESNVLIAEAAAGKPLRILGTMFQSSPMGWMYLDGGAIGSFTDLADKRVGVHDDGWRVLKLLLEKSGIDISRLDTFNCSYDPKVVIDGEADAMQCYYIDEFVRLQQLVGEQAKVFLAKDYGYEAYSQVIFTHAETIDMHPEIVSGFLRALKKGWAYAFAHTEATVDLILSQYAPDLDRDYQLSSLQKIEELMVPEPGALFRPIELSVLEAGQRHLLSFDLIERPAPLESVLMQSFLP